MDFLHIFYQHFIIICDIKKVAEKTEWSLSFPEENTTLLPNKHLAKKYFLPGSVL